ncbi:TIGR03435 family protein [Terriglobus saanensis]|uniref:TIGR03435 family protein n=1 Tax=Terriglobus saanensis TaxID=870903 RepID=UPI0002DDBDC1|nr:TIGR03435 family protein [Terriglobus saanensis]
MFAQTASGSGENTSSAAPAFEIADVHPSPPRAFPFADGGSLHGDRYAYRQATMLNLISTAYGLDPNNVQGGPSWLEMDRFDIVAKAPAKSNQADLKLMLKSLLANRFALIAHNGTAPMPAYALGVIPGGKPKMTESDGTAQTGCVPHPPPQNEAPGVVSNIVVTCHNMTMETFAEMVHMMAGGYLANPVVDATGLKGSWDFDLTWTGKGQLQKAGADGISIFDALQKQLGLNLELKTAPRAVLIVDSVNEKPTPNPPGIESALPTPPPAQFDVATIKPGKAGGNTSGRINGGQIDLQSITLKTLLDIAWELNPNDDEAIVGAAKWLDVDKFDILAKVSNDALSNAGPTRPPIDIEDLRNMLKGLLIERFQMKVHKEDRPVSAYTLIAVSPKLKKADPSSRTRCTEGPGPDGKDPRIASPILNRLVTCQNMNMAQIGEEFQRVAAGFIYSPVLDATGIKGAWDFTLSFSSADLVKGTGAPGASGGASDPNGALSFFDAVNKQLGLKLEKQKRPVPVLVIDHVEEKPTEN